MNFFFSHYVRGLKFNAAVKWITIMGGTLGAIFSGYMAFKKQNAVREVTPVSSGNPKTSEKIENSLATIENAKKIAGSGGYNDKF
jgi:esterase/lipase